MLFYEPEYEALFANIELVRAHRDSFLSEISAGKVSLAAIFERAHTDPVLSSMKVLPALESLPGAKKVVTRRAFEELDVSEGALIVDVTPEVVNALPAAIERHGI